jgi:periplasmic protein CpxP/Spy
MKAKMSLLALLMIAVTCFTYAQGGGGFQMPSAEERTKSVMEKLGDLKLDKDQTVKTDSVFANFYRGQAKKFEEMRAGGGGDREAMRAEMEKMTTDRDDKLKKVWSADQFKKFKDEIEPTLRQRRGGGGQ